MKRKSSPFLPARLFIRRAFVQKDRNNIRTLRFYNYDGLLIKNSTDISASNVSKDGHKE